MLQDFDQKTWERYVARWVAASDQPFSSVEEPEFIEMIRYCHGSDDILKIPCAKTVRNHIMIMGENFITDTKTMLAVCVPVS